MGKKKRPSTLKTYHESQKRMREINTIKDVRGFIPIIIIIIIVILLMSGIINQKKLGKSYMEIILGTGEKIGEASNKFIFDRKDFIIITEDGIYIKPFYDKLNNDDEETKESEETNENEETQENEEDSDNVEE